MRQSLVMAGLLALVLLASIPALVAIYTPNYRNNEGWRSAASAITANPCAEGQGYVNLSATYLFGVAYYEPALLQRAHEIGPGSLMDALASTALMSSDWILLRRNHYSVGGERRLANVTNYLKSLGYRPQDFPSLRLFMTRSC